MGTHSISPNDEDDRFLKWLKSLPAWDGVKRLYTPLDDACGSPVDENPKGRVRNPKRQESTELDE